MSEVTMNTLRLKAVKDNMKVMGLDSFIITSVDALFYLTGHEIHPGERLMALVVNQESEAFVLNRLFPLQDESLTIVSYSDGEDGIGLLARSIKDGAVVGIDKEWPSRFLIELLEKRNDITVKNGSWCIDKARLYKDDDEKIKMREASAINDQVMSEIYNAIKYAQSCTESAVQEWVDEKNANLGVHELSFTPLICFGENGSEPHHDSDQTPLKSGDAIIVDIGGRKNGYCSDMTRSFFYGQPSAKYIEVYETVLKANLAAIDTVKPGVTFAEIDKAARDVIAAAGYGDYFTHRTGHGIGINVHEFPDVSSVNDMICEAGMVFSIEPGIYLTGEFGVRIEDLVLVTDDGCEVLNAYPKHLQIIE